MAAPGAIFWSGLEAALSAGFSFVSAFVVARIIGPAEMGAGAAAVAVHVLLWVGVNALFADAIVQRTNLDEEAAASAFWASALVGTLAAAVQAAAGWPLAAAMGDPRLVAMSLALAAPLPLVGAGGAVQGKLTRERRYRLLACRALIGQGAGTAVGIGAALHGAGAWALVGQQATTSAIGALALLLGSGWRPRAMWRWTAVREMLRLGGPLTVSTLVLHGRYRMFALLIGGTAGATTLGEVHMAFRLVDTMRELVSTALWRLMLPAMSERQHDVAGLRAEMDRWLHLIGRVLFPLCAAMLVAIGPLVRLLLDPVWAPASTATLPLVALAAWLFLQFPSGVAAVARGAPRIALHASLASSVAVAVGILIVRPTSPVAAVAIWLAAQAAVAPYTLRTTARVLGTPLLRPLRAGLRAFACCAIAAGCALTLPRLLGRTDISAGILGLSLVGTVLLLGGLGVGRRWVVGLSRQI